MAAPRALEVRDALATGVVLTRPFALLEAWKLPWGLAPVQFTGVRVTFGVGADLHPRVPYICGEDIEVVQEQLALDGKMNAKTRKLVIGAMRDCEITYLAIGTIDINTPRDSNVDGGLSVVVSINGQVLDLSRKFPKKVAAIGPVQARAGGLEDNEAVRNALIIAGNMAGKEIVSRLHAKKIK